MEKGFEVANPKPGDAAIFVQISETPRNSTPTPSPMTIVVKDGQDSQTLEFRDPQEFAEYLDRVSRYRRAAEILDQWTAEDQGDDGLEAERLLENLAKNYLAEQRDAAE